MSPLLKGIGETEIVDELRVIISEEERTTAYFTFSSQMRPSIHEFRIYGSKNGLILDQDHEILLRLRGDKIQELRRQLHPPGAVCEAASRKPGGERKIVSWPGISTWIPA